MRLHERVKAIFRDQRGFVTAAAAGLGTAAALGGGAAGAGALGAGALGAGAGKGGMSALAPYAGPAMSAAGQIMAANRSAQGAALGGNSVLPNSSSGGGGGQSILPSGGSSASPEIAALLAMLAKGNMPGTPGGFSGFGPGLGET